MSIGDARLQQLIYYWIIPIFIVFLVCKLLIKKFGKAFQEWLFVALWSKELEEYHEAMKGMKGEHFSSMKYHKSADPNLNRGLLRILEIGGGSGGNFEFFPPNSRLTVVEPNTFFEPKFFEKQSKYPELTMERFVVAKAEDMKEIEDNSVDVVVSTLVLCSVDSVEQTLKEVHRVLTPGGKYYYWEHVHDTPGTLLHAIQSLLTFIPIWTFLTGNCHLNRNIDVIVKNEKEFSNVEQKRFDIPFTKGTLKLVRVHVMGVATK